MISNSFARQALPLLAVALVCCASVFSSSCSSSKTSDAADEVVSSEEGDVAPVAATDAVPAPEMPAVAEVATETPPEAKVDSQVDAVAKTFTKRIRTYRHARSAASSQVAPVAAPEAVAPPAPIENTEMPVAQPVAQEMMAPPQPVAAVEEPVRAPASPRSAEKQDEVAVNEAGGLMGTLMAYRTALIGLLLAGMAVGAGVFYRKSKS